MYFEPTDSKIARRTKTAAGEFTLYTNGTVKNPEGIGKDINDLLDDPIVVDNHPGNVFQVIGDVMYIAALKKDQFVSEDMMDNDDGDPAYHSRAYLIAIDWRSWSRVWDRELGLGGLTALAVTDTAVYAAGFREYTTNDEVRTIVARIDLSGDLTWMQEMEAASTPRPTEIEVSPNELSVYVDSFNAFMGKVIRFKLDLSLDGHLRDIKTL